MMDTIKGRASLKCVKIAVAVRAQVAIGRDDGALATPRYMAEITSHPANKLPRTVAHLLD